jgi:hypothetical protein
MEYVKILWITIFFLFSLSLIFIWSKLLVLTKRVAAIADLIVKCDTVSEDSPIEA